MSAFHQQHVANVLLRTGEQRSKSPPEETGATACLSPAGLENRSSLFFRIAKRPRPGR
jgi:hypothetical protein